MGAERDPFELREEADPNMPDHLHSEHQKLCEGRKENG
jgi:hypothetical protein